MKGIFNIESKFGHMLLQFSHLILLSLCWIFFSIPIFTWGASSCAIYTACRKMLHDGENKPVHNFYVAFKQNFKQGCIVGIMTLLFLLIVMYCFLLAVGTGIFNDTIGGIARIVYIAVIGSILIYIHYVISYITRFEDKLKTVLRNCVYLCLCHFDTTLRLAAQFALVAVAFYFLDLLPYLPLIVMLLPAGYSLVTVDPLEKVFKQYMPKDQPEAEEPDSSN